MTSIQYVIVKLQESNATSVHCYLKETHQNKCFVFSDAGLLQSLPSRGVSGGPTWASLGPQGEKERVWSCPPHFPPAAAVSAAEEQP